MANDLKLRVLALEPFNDGGLAHLLELPWPKGEERTIDQSTYDRIVQSAGANAFEITAKVIPPHRPSE